MNRKTRRFLVLLVLAAGAPAQAQDPNVFRPGLSLGYEARHDRFRYQFDNPSRFNTVELVPHNFVQTYTADNHWATLRGRYRALGQSWETGFAVTPQRTTYGDDYDTFFQPDGNVIVSGTRGKVSMRSYEIFQRVVLGEWKGVSPSIGYRYRRDRAEFQFGASFEIQSKPPSVIIENLPINETTISQVHDVQIGFRKDWDVSREWSLVAEFDLSPTEIAHLTTILPDKYPGQKIVFLDKSLGLSSRVALVWNKGRFPLEIYFAYGRNWSYESSGELRRESSALGIRIGLF
jgi:hypothetical protein